MSTEQKTSRMTDAHKASLARGRAQGKIVREYLQALSIAPKRGRKRTKESIDARLLAINGELAGADPIRQLHLRQEAINLQNERAVLAEKVDTSKLESEFLKVAKSYSASKGVSYQAWRAVGVPASVLSRAGVQR